MLVRYVGREASSPTHLPVLHTAEQLLAERFARGELDETEYRSRLGMAVANGQDVALSATLPEGAVPDGWLMVESPGTEEVDVPLAGG